MSESSTVMTALTVEQRAEKGDEMASLVAQIDAIKSQAKAKAFEYRNAIEALHEQLVELSNAMRFGLEPTSQMSLTFTQARAAKSATEQLAEIAKHACTCEGGPESETKSPTCPVHGVGTQEPKPEPCDQLHEAPVCGHPECWLIGAGEEAEVERADGSVHGESGAEVDAEYHEAEASNVVDMATRLREAEVDVGTVEEPAVAKAFRRGKRA